MALGDSIRRSHRPRRRGRGDAAEGDAPAGDAPAGGGPDGTRRWLRGGGGSRLPWPWWLAIGLVLGGLLLGAGYLLAEFVIFPPTQDTNVVTVTVPELRGKDQAQARQALGGVRLALGLVDEQPDPTAAPGTIVAQAPLAGQQMLPGETVDVGLSTGPASVMLPDVTGFPVARATAMLSSLGFTVQQRTVQDDAAAGRVVGMTPDPTASYTLPRAVMLDVSAGPPPPADSLAPDSTARPDTVPAKPGTVPGRGPGPEAGSGRR